MAKITMTETEEFTVLPIDAVIFVSCTNTKIIDLDGKYGPWQKLEFEFVIDRVLNEDYKDAVSQRIWGSVPFRFTDHPDNKLKQWVEALLGLELVPGYELDTEDLVGRKARAVVGQYTTRDGNPRHQVEALLPLTSGEPSNGQPSNGQPKAQEKEPVLDEIPF